jgi:FHA domain-containing protein
MTLTLRAVSLNDQPLTQPITARFDLQGGTIGRADHNTMALPDPERHISREQAEIIGGLGGFVIRNVGSSNPILVRNQPLAHGESAPLLHKDQVRIGRYLLEVVDDAAGGADVDATTQVRSPGGTVPATPPRASSLAVPMPMPAAEPVPPLSPGNPFADLFAAPARLPDDFDPFAVPGSAPAAPSRPEVPAGASMT